MKNLLVIFILFLSIQSCVTAKYKCEDKRACKEYEKKLDILSDFLYYEKPIEEANETWFDGFFEKVTGHKSEANMSYDGIDPPTLNDFKNYTSWYSLNHNKLRYNLKTDKVYTLKSNLTFLKNYASEVDSRDITVFLPKQNDLVALINRNDGIGDVSKNHYYIKTGIDDIHLLFDILDDNDAINELYIFPFDDKKRGYEEVDSKKIKTLRRVKLFFQITLGESYHSDDYFVLISDKEKAKKILSDLSSNFKENIGFVKLKEKL